MQKIFAHITAVLLLFLLCTSAAETEKRIVKDFSLQNVDGKIISTKDFKDAKGLVVIFTCIHCPFAKLYHERLNKLHTKYSKLHLPLLLINSSDTIMFANESLPNMAKVAKEKKYAFPYLFDPSQVVAKDFRAEKTPHAFVIWKENKQWVIKYSGAIDDNGAHPELVKTSYIANALDELLAGKAVTVNSGYSIGCAIHYRK